MRVYFTCLSIFLIASLSAQSLFPDSELKDSVEIIVDHWGIPHIYAQNQHDLFYAQGYHAAQTRLFQFELWRRQATGTVAELLGPRELKRDIGTRLFKFRKDINQEMAHYHEDGVEIIEAYVAGINAYITEINTKPELLPMEFKLLKTKPQLWTPEVVISRHQGLLGNITQELDIGRAVAIAGEDKVKELVWFHPLIPDLTFDPAINTSRLQDDILGSYNAFRRPVRFHPEDIVAGLAADPADFTSYATQPSDLIEDDDYDIGSNNWAITGALSASGSPILANDPHRSLAVPSLRYMAHLNAPGWNVIGGGEPEIPGISIGHNEFGAWGLTVYRTDAEDLYVYKTNPDDVNQYWHQGEWLDFKVLKEMIPVKNAENFETLLFYSVHGPVTLRDTINHIAYAVKCGWLEYGGSPYLASLRMDQAENFEEFRDACNYSNIPGENMVWADKEGNIGWQVVGINPIRTTHSGMIPVPGDGRYEWEKYIEIKDRPHVYNPEEQIIVTANQNVTSSDYKHINTVAFNWSDPYRGNRVKEMLNSGYKHTILDMTRLQSDYLSIAARQLVPFLKGIAFNSSELVWASNQLLEWDLVLDAESVEASIYVTWERIMKEDLWEQAVPEEIKKYIRSIQVTKMVDWITFPTKKLFGEDPIQGRDQFLYSSLAKTMSSLEKRFGKDKSKWQYGQEKFKHVKMMHPLSPAVNEEVRSKLEVGPLPRGGYALTVGSTGSRENQSSGGTFRIVVDTGDWDRSLANNAPGQSGNPDEDHYDNLFSDWSKDKYFPMFYSKTKVLEVKDYSYTLSPKK